MLIRPCADLRNNYNEISKICHETMEPIYITKHGSTDLVLLSDKVYETMLNVNQKNEEERIDRLISKHFEKHYKTFEEFQKYVFKEIEKSLNDIKGGKIRPIEDFCKEMRLNSI